MTVLRRLVNESDFSHPAPHAHISPQAVSLQNANSADSLLHISEGVPLGGAVRGCHPPQLDILQCL